MSSEQSTPSSYSQTDPMTIIQAIVAGTDWEVTFNAKPDEYHRGIRFHREQGELHSDSIRVIPVYNTNCETFMGYKVKVAEGWETDSTVIDTAATKTEALKIAKRKINNI